MIRINKNLALFSSLIFVLGTILLLTVQKFSPLIGRAVYYCQSFIETQIIPLPYYLGFFPIALIFLILGISIARFLILFFRIQLLKKSLESKKLGKIEKKVILVKSTRYFAFCLGIRNTKIYISSGLIGRLSKEEIKAVLEHEQYHLDSHDTATLIIASVAHSLFPFFPLIGDLIKRYLIEREIQADSYAVKKVGDSYPLVSALRKLLLLPAFETAAIAAIANHDTLEPRIYALLQKSYTSRQFSIKHLLVTLFSAFVFGVIMITPLYAQEIHHQEHDVIMLCSDGEECMQSCTSEENMSKLYSEMPNASHPYTPVQ